MDEHALDDVDEASEVKIVAAQETNESPNDQPTNPKPGIIFCYNEYSLPFTVSQLQLTH